MAAVNMSVMPANMPLDFMPVHSRSNSFSSASTHSSSRPQSSQGAYGQMSSMPGPEDMYRAGYHMPIDHNPGHGSMQPHRRPSHIRARAAASPYPRDTDSVHSSSSETDDIGMFLGPQQSDYHPMYGSPGVHMHLGPSQETMHTTNAMGRMSIAAHAVSNDQALEKLAANVRAATTTSASDRAKQIFVQAWLTANYAPYPDGNVPRQGLYFSYRRVCDQYGIPHINTATLGKAIRLCFPTIKTRRLGVRGNSKYHYCGIRPATSTEAEFLQDYIHKSNNTAGQQSVNAARLAVQEQEGPSPGDGSDEEEDDESDGATSGLRSKRNSLHLPTEKSAAFASHDLADKTPTANTALSQVQAQRPGSFASQASIRRHPGQEAQALAFASTSAIAAPPAGALAFAAPPPTISVRQFPNFPQIEEAVGANSTSPHGIAAREVWGWFLDHLDAILDSVRHFRFDQFEMTLRNFWMNLTGNHREVVHAPAIAGLMAKADAIVYDEILEILRSQMLTPIPSQSLANLRQLAIKMEKILVAALDNYGNTFVEPKVELGARFGHLILRFLDIYQVIQALNTVLTNPKQLSEMRRSWQKVDFDSVRNQSALVCNCRHEDLVQLLEVDFVALMDTLAKTPEPVKEVMSWADKCCERLMGGRGVGGADERGSMSSRSVLIRWGYVTSQVMRDLTIRSDPAFGAFQILKLFLDDWISVNVLRTVALSTNSVAASVEPVMQQQFFSMSPMPGQESFGAAGMMAHTPTTSSMLAALQSETFASGALDAQAGFGADAYASLSYMDTPGAPGADAGMAPVEHITGGSGDHMSAGAEHHGMHGGADSMHGADPMHGAEHLSAADHMSDQGLSFAEFGASGGAFDVGFGAQDLMGHAAAAATPGSGSEDAGSVHSSASPALAGSPAAPQ